MADVIHRETLEYRRSVNTPEYDPGEWLINPAIPECPPEYWEVSGDEVIECSPTDRLIIDAQKLDAAKVAKADQITAEFTDALASRYSADVQRDLLSMLDEARQNNNAEMAEHIQKVQIWKNAGKLILWEAHDAVAAAESLVDVAAVSIDLTDWLYTDPQISLREIGE